jgi:hypothetical protein
MSNLPKRAPVAPRQAPAAQPELEHRVLAGTLEPIRRNQPEPRATITVQLPFDLDLKLEARADSLGIKKRDIIVSGIRMALESERFKV